MKLPRPYTPYVKPHKSAEQALTQLMDQCARCERSTGDARRSLYRWGVDSSEHEAIITRLVDEKFIDNSRYAYAYVREKANLSGWGSYKIRTALRTKEIPEETINEALSELDTQVMDDKLEEMLRRKMRTTRSKNAYDLRGKLLRFGSARGFDFSRVSELVDRLVSAPQED